MRVDDVIVQGEAAREGNYAAGERGELRRQLLFAQAFVGTRHDVDDAQSLFDLHDLALRGPRGEGKDVYLDAPARELACGVEDVDIHAARIPGSGLFQGRGVHGDHRDTHRLPS